MWETRASITHDENWSIINLLDGRDTNIYLNLKYKVFALGWYTCTLYSHSVNLTISIFTMRPVYSDRHWKINLCWNRHDVRLQSYHDKLFYHKSTSSAKTGSSIPDIMCWSLASGTEVFTDWGLRRTLPMVCNRSWLARSPTTTFLKGSLKQNPDLNLNSVAQQKTQVL